MTTPSDLPLFIRLKEEPALTAETVMKSHPVEATPPLTGEELFAMGDIGRSELVKGELVLMSPTGHPHGYYEVNFTTALHNFVRHHQLGRVLGGKSAFTPPATLIRCAGRM